MNEIEDYMDTDDYRFTMSLMTDMDKPALVALYYTALHAIAEETDIDLFDVHNNIIDSLTDAKDALSELH